MFLPPQLPMPRTLWRIPLGEDVTTTSEGGQGFIDYEVGLQCRVNGKPGRGWMLIVAYEPSDKRDTRRTRFRDSRDTSALDNG